jgi:hypothetical protein
MRKDRAASLLAAAAVLAILAAAPAAGQSPLPGSGSLRASFEPAQVSVGGLSVLTLSYLLPEGGRLTDPPETGGLEGLTVIRMEESPGTIRLSLLVDRIDRWEAETITLAYLDGAGERQTLETEGAALDVLSNLGEKPEEAELRPLRDILPTVPVWLKIFPWAAGLLFLLLSAGAVSWWIGWKRARRLAAGEEDPPHVIARRAIDRLEARGVFEEGKVKEYYFALSEIMRRYLESVRAFPAAEYTTEEIARHMRLEEDLKLLGLLREADMVKFADDLPTAARKGEGVRRALAYIGATSPSEGPVPVNLGPGEKP